jgi:hypothetical protein
MLLLLLIQLLRLLLLLLLLLLGTQGVWSPVATAPAASAVGPLPD